MKPAASDPWAPLLRLVPLWLGLLLPACGWHAGLLAPAGANSVGVEIFETERTILERNLEPIVSNAITRALDDMVQTELRAPQRADVVIQGEILNYNRRSGARTQDNELVETGIYVRIRAQLTERKSGKILVGPIERHSWSGYALAGEAPENEDQARLRVIDYVARTLVLDLFAARIPVAEPTPTDLN